MRNLIIKKALFGFVGLLLGVSMFVTPGAVSKVNAEGGNGGRVFLPVVSNQPQPRSGTGMGNGNSYYVSTGGKSSGNGSASRPWDLQTALKQPGAVKPGDNIWVHGGTYRGTFLSSLKGASGNPITVRAFPGERVILDSHDNSEQALQVGDSYYANFWGMEITNSALTRNKGDRPGGGDGVGIRSNNNSHDIKFINMIVHDVSAMGFAFWSENTNSEIYGSLIYYVGGMQLEHGIYTQNKNGWKRLTDNIIFNNASHGIHAYGSSKAYLNNFTISGNTSFCNGSIGYNSSTGKYNNPARNILIGGSVLAKNPVVTNNYTYFPSNVSSGAALNVGYNAGSSNAKVTNNYLVGGTLQFGGSNSGMTVSGNTVYVSDVTGIKESSYSSNKWLSSKPGGAAIFVRPNQYEPGRANITIYNWDHKSTVTVSAGSLNGVLNKGDRYQLHNVQDYFGDVITGTYNGSSISVPMTGRKVAQPVGLSFKPASTFPEFGAFVLIVPGK